MRLIERMVIHIEYKINRLRSSYFRVFRGIEIGKGCIIEKGAVLKRQYGGNFSR